MWFRKKAKTEKKPYKEGELSIVSAVLSIISEHPKDRIEIYDYTDYFATLLQNSNIDFETQEFSFSWMKRVLIIEPQGKQRITIDYWKAENFKFVTEPSKSIKPTPTIQEADIIRHEILQVSQGLYLPRVVVDGHLTKDQYIDALYVRLDNLYTSLGTKDKIRRGIGLEKI